MTDDKSTAPSADSTPLPAPPTRYVTSDAQLADVCSAVRAGNSFAFDTEFVMEDRYEADVCVVQIGTDELVAVVDPLAGVDLQPVWDLVADPALEVIVHAGMEDLSLCQSRGGVTPSRVFDCQLGYGLISTDYPLSLLRLVRRLLGVRLRKGQTLTDWRRRPLTQDQIFYAAADVIHLPAVHRKISAKLEELGRTEWMQEEMARYANSKTYQRDRAENVLRLKGAGSLDAKGLAIARELVKAREALAAKYNRPARGVIRDHLIVEIGRNRLTSARQIKSLRGLHLRSDGVQELAAAAQRACELPREQWPEPIVTTEETDSEAAMAFLVASVVRAHCAQHDIAHQLVATKQDIHKYVQAVARGADAPASRVPFANGWRERSVGRIVHDLIDGRLHVGIRQDDGRPSIDLTDVR